jgi:RNA polymerase sigma-70 factor (ECF subfamily)
VPAGPIRDPALAAAVEAFQTGRDRDGGFRVLFERFHPAVRRFFARKGLPPEDCLDLTQETFLGIYTGLEAWRGDSRLETWIFRIATTTYLKRLRAGRTHKRTGREVATEDAAPHEPALRTAAGQLDRVLGRERRQALRAAVRGLPEKMRKCLTLRLEHGLKYGDIATVLNVSEQTVKAHLFQARRRLRSELGELVLDLEGAPGEDSS